MASFSSSTAPMCQPPRQMIETRWPVLPRIRVGNPVGAALLVWTSAADRAAFVKNCLREVSSVMKTTLSFRPLIETPAQLLQAAQNFVAKSLIGGRRFPFYEEGAARLQNAALDLTDVGEALPVAHRGQLGFSKQLLSQVLAADFAVLDQDSRAALQNLIDAPVAKQKADYQIISKQQAEGADQAAGDRVVVSDNGVLHRVGKRQQHHQVEGIQLRQLAFSKDAQEQDEEHINDNGADKLFKDGDIERKHFITESHTG